jgi:5-carboxymethyl-2-hydroxymuconate isomerase
LHQRGVRRAASGNRIFHDGHEVLDISELMRALHVAAVATEVMHGRDIEIRAISYGDYLVAGIRDGFCHVSVFLLEGRTPEQKLKLSETLCATLSESLPRTKSLSVDIRDMDASAYKKRLLPD